MGGHLNCRSSSSMISPRTGWSAELLPLGSAHSYWCLLLLPADEYGTDRQQISAADPYRTACLVNRVRNIVLTVAMLFGMQIQHKLRQCAVHASNLPFHDDKAGTSQLNCGCKVEARVHFTQRHMVTNFKVKLTRVPQRLTSTLSFSSLPTGTSSAGRLGMVSAISRISACKASSSALLHPALRPVCSLPDVKARYLPRAFARQWISIGSYAPLAGFPFDL